VPLRTILVVPFVVQIVGTVGIVGYLSFKNGQKAVNEVAGILRSEITVRVQQYLTHYVEVVHTANQMNANALANDEFDFLDEPKKAERRYLQLMEAFPTLTEIYTGDIKGNDVGVSRSIEGKLNVFESHGNELILRNYEVDQQGNRGKLVGEYPDFDPRRRPWYLQSVEANKPVWNEIFPDFSTKQLALSGNQVVYDETGKFIGAVGSSIWLDDFSKFLGSLKVGHSGQIFILERSDGELVSTSTQDPVFLIKGEKTERIKASDSQNPLIHETTNFLEQHFSGLTNINESQQLSFELKGQRQFLQVAPVKDDRGLDWLIVVAIPESDFMGEINANTRNTILLSLLALTLSVMIGVLTARRITQPILRLKDAATAFADGKFDQKIDTDRQDELGVLTGAFNSMATQLQTAFAKLQQTNEELETRVEERTAELKEAKAVADAANHAKSDFLANMSHELRTPLNGVLGYAQILNRSVLNPQQHRGVEIIYQCGSHLLTLINDILDLSKIEARKLELHPKAFHLPSFLQGVVEICRIRADQKGIDFIYQPPADLPTAIEVDEKRLRQVLINLLGNAIKFTDQGSVTFKVNVVKVESLEISPAPKTQLQFQIVDTGVGMSPEQLNKIFQPFEQVGDTKKQAEGTGLGLSISQRIVELMNSHIQVQSTLNQGSLFEFTIACPFTSDWLQSQSVTRLGKIVGYQGDRQHILVVDDRWENRSVLLNLLEPFGFSISEADHGRTALDKATYNQPDLIITDLAMPVMDGWQFLSELRQSDLLKSIPVIVSSASVYDFDRQKSLDAGGDDFLPKPVQADELYETLAKHLQLTWIYEKAESELSESSESSATETEMIIPLISELETLLNHTKSGYIKGIRAELDNLSQINAKYQPFVNQLLPLVRSFNIEKIRQFLQETIGNA
jgi:signal transduction histidine kinase/DNA-binding NarL/FixJ family response regulator